MNENVEDELNKLRNEVEYLREQINHRKYLNFIFK